MSLPIFWTPEARADLREARLWYEERRAGLGGRFVGAVGQTLDAMADNPLQFAVLHRNMRRARVRGFRKVCSLSSRPIEPS